MLSKRSAEGETSRAHRRLLLRRLGRSLFWGYPLLYWPVGIVRHRGNCLTPGFEVWIDGYPRSANSFCVQLFKSANPGIGVRSHRHLPPFIIQALNYGLPGIFLLRKPVDAAASWAIYTQGSLGESLDYHVDFHRAIRPYISVLFVASFEQVTCDFGAVVRKFNSRFGRSYAAPCHDDASIQRCFTTLEASRKAADERRTHSPSCARQVVKSELLQEFNSTPRLKQKLDLANELYLEFRACGQAGGKRLAAASTAQLPTFP